MACRTTNIVGGLTSGGARLRVSAQDFAEYKAILDRPAHLFAEIYTMRFSEQIMIYDYERHEGVDYLLVQRGMSGTAARPWPASACLRITDEVEGKPCPDDDAAATLDPEAVTAALRVGRGLEIIDGVLRLKATGVETGSYGGAEVNTTGQFLSIPRGWPASAVPAFDTCDGPAPPGPNPDPSGTVTSVEGILPDRDGDVAICRNLPGAGPLEAVTRVLVCSQGRMSFTTAEELAALVPAPEIPSLEGLVRSVGGVGPDTDGAVSFHSVGRVDTLDNLTLLVDTPEGVRRIDPSTLVAALPAGDDVQVDYDAGSGLLLITVGGHTGEAVVMPFFDAEVSGSKILIQHGTTQKELELPAPAIELELEISPTGVLKVKVNDAEAELQLPVVTAFPTTEESAGTPHYTLSRTATGDMAFYKVT